MVVQLLLLLLLEFFTSALADGFSLESEWQQVFRTRLKILAVLSYVVVWIIIIIIIITWFFTRLKWCFTKFWVNWSFLRYITLLNISYDHYGSVIWMVSIFPLNFSSFSLVLWAPISIDIIITVTVFHCFFSSLARSLYFSICLLSSIFTQVCWNGKNLQMTSSFLSCWC